jgi:hypothetical protein
MCLLVGLGVERRPADHLMVEQMGMHRVGVGGEG